MEQTETKQKKKHGVKIAKVVSTKADKTATVTVDNLVRHPMYGKYVHRRTKLAVHDPNSDAKVADMVEIVPCRKISKTKTWRLLRVIRRATDVMREEAQSQG